MHLASQRFPCRRIQTDTFWRPFQTAAQSLSLMKYAEARDPGEGGFCEETAEYCMRLVVAQPCESSDQSNKTDV
nr:hypothetical protein BgiMline_014715 [Biomphalaria glabrata]